MGFAQRSTASFLTLSAWAAGQAPRLFPWFVQKRRQALTFLATIENDHGGMNTLAVISILALLAISGAAYTDQILKNDQPTVQGVG
jgi:hypothetical protein